MSSARAARFALYIPMVCFCMVFSAASPRAESAGPVSYEKFDKTTYLVDRATGLPDCGTTPDELPCRLQSFFACKVRRDPALCETLGIRMDGAGQDLVFGIEDFAGSPELIEVEFRAQWVRRLYDQTFAIQVLVQYRWDIGQASDWVETRFTFWRPLGDWRLVAWETR